MFSFKQQSYEKAFIHNGFYSSFSHFSCFVQSFCRHKGALIIPFVYVVKIQLPEELLPCAFLSHTDSWVDHVYVRVFW